MLDEGEEADADDGEVIVLSKGWSGLGLGEAGGSIARECRLYLLVYELEGTG